ncbi:MAG: hypothetical protein BWY82_02205 [Verrucomicrobia bacterium ADurb.Bin474]|nr:MAG: hypothetical protein BWY82_02205 [Verrucomicrobia bacterium ADurb.Bin474]
MESANAAFSRHHPVGSFVYVDRGCFLPDKVTGKVGILPDNSEAGRKQHDSVIPIHRVEGNALTGNPDADNRPPVRTGNGGLIGWHILTGCEDCKAEASGSP